MKPQQVSVTSHHHHVHFLVLLCLWVFENSGLGFLLEDSSQMFNGVPPSVPITNIPTEEIQKCLEENQGLILTIMEYQRVGRFEECAPHRAQLQQNLTFLAKLADGLPQQQPPPPAVPPQMLVHSMMQQGQRLQQPEAAMSQQQAAPSSARMHIQLKDHQQQQPLWLHQQQFIQAQMGINPIAASNIHTAPKQLGDGSGSDMLDLRGNNAGNFLGKLFAGYSRGDTGF